MKWIAPTFALIVGLTVGILLSPRLEKVAVSESASSGETGLIEMRSKEGRAKPVGSSGAIEVVNVSGEELDVEWLNALNDLSGYERMGALYAKLKTVQASDFPVIMDEYTKEGQTDWYVVGMLGSRWADVDPEGMFKYIESKGGHNWSLYNALYQSWGKSDSAAALASISGLNSNLKKNAASIIATGMLETFPEQALMVMKEYLGNGQSSQWQYQQFFGQWAKLDMAAAMAAAEEFGQAHLNSSALFGVISVQITDDPMTVLKQLREVKVQDSMRRGLISQAMTQLYMNDPQTAMDYISSTENFLERKRLLESLYFNQSDTAHDYDTIVGMIDWVDTVATGSLRNNKVRELLNVMAQSDPYRAKDYILEMKYGAARTDGLAQVAHVLMENDFDAAQALANSLEFEDEKLRVLETMGWQLRHSNPELAREFVLNSGTTLQDRLAGPLASDWSIYDREAALLWVDQLESADAKSNAIGDILRTWVLDDAEGAFGYIANSVDENKAPSLYNNALQTYFREDPISAIGWLDTLSAQEQLGDRPEDYYRDAAQAYIHIDQMAASEWIATLDEGKKRDYAVYALVNSISRTDPEAGFQWAATISDERQRKQYIERAVRNWVKIDADAAIDAINQANLDNEQKDALFNLIETK